MVAESFIGGPTPLGAATFFGSLIFDGTKNPKEFTVGEFRAIQKKAFTPSVTSESFLAAAPLRTAEFEKFVGRGLTDSDIEQLEKGFDPIVEPEEFEDSLFAEPDRLTYPTRIFTPKDDQDFRILNRRFIPQFSDPLDPFVQRVFRQNEYEGGTKYGGAVRGRAMPRAKPQQPAKRPLERPGDPNPQIPPQPDYEAQPAPDVLDRPRYLPPGVQPVIPRVLPEIVRPTAPEILRPPKVQTTPGRVTAPQIPKQAPARPRIAQKAPATVRGRITFATQTALATAVGVATGRLAGQPRLSPTTARQTGRQPRLGSPAEPAIPGTQLAPPQTLTQFQPQRKTRKEQEQCEKKARKNRVTCWEGFFREYRNKTKFVKWNRVDCQTRKTLEER